MKGFLFTRSFLFLALFSVACQGTKGDGDSAQAASGGPGSPAGIVNVQCPGMPDNAAKEDVTVDYKGQKVGFCCKGCIGDWEKMSESEKDAFLASQAELKKKQVQK